MSNSRSLRVRLLSILFGFSLLATACGGEAEDAGPSVTVARTSTPVTTASTTTESTTTTTTEPTTTEEETEADDEAEDLEESTTTAAPTTTATPTTLAFADDDSAAGGGSGSGNGDTATATTVAGGADTTAVAGDAAETTTTIATTTTIDPFAPLENFDQIVLPFGDAVSSVSVQSVNLKCDSNGVSPQVLIFAPFDLSGADQQVTFYGPSGAAYVATGQAGSGNIETFTTWLSDPVVADSFDWVAICSQPSWKVLIELSDEEGPLFTAAAFASISG